MEFKTILTKVIHEVCLHQLLLPLFSSLIYYLPTPADPCMLLNLQPLKALRKALRSQAWDSDTRKGPSLRGKGCEKDTKKD